MQIHSFYFLRHAETDHNLYGRPASGDTDISLNAAGKRQAQKAQPLIHELPISKVYFSPMKRVLETKDIVCQDLSIPQEEVFELKEFNSTDGSKEAFCARVQRALIHCCKGEGTPLLISHGDVFQAVKSVLGLSSHYEMLGNCAIAQLEPHDGGSWILEYVH